jgi:hypothetical protein
MVSPSAGCSGGMALLVGDGLGGTASRNASRYFSPKDWQPTLECGVLTPLFSLLSRPEKQQ